MILIGIDRTVDSEKSVFFANTIADIENSPSGSLVVMKFDKNFLEFFATASIPLAIEVANIRDFVLASQTNAKYAIADLELAKSLQSVADHYLLDIKVLAISSDIEVVALAGIDGVFAVDL